MLPPFLLLTLLSTIICHPIQDVENTTENVNNESSLYVVHLQKDLNIVTYIQNFKNIMAQYVSSQYKDLTVRELDEVKNVLEEFLKNFAKDLRDVVENSNEDVKWGNEERVPDGMPDHTFDEIRTAIRTEFPDISEETSKEIVYRLRKNLFVTREKLDGIIISSHNAQVAHSME